MFDNLTNRLLRTFLNINDYRYLTEDNIKKTLSEVRKVLLEADVALPVVRSFINHVREKAVGHEVNKSLTPKQEFIKIVHNELVFAMGEKNQALNLEMQTPSVILVVGLQGSGKTTSVGKLGNFLRKKYNKKVLLVSVDIYRPAAIKQLEVLAKKASVDFFQSNINQKPIDIIASALKEANHKFYDVLLVDTAGRLHTNNMMMNEIQQINSLIHPIENLFVVDSMLGQDSINIAKSFNEKLPLTGIVLTKVDGDSRGGAALSVQNITGKPIKFLGLGEKINAFEPFYPERIASRILGMGDVLSLIEDIENNINHEKTKNLSKKSKKNNNFDLTDFLEQIHQIKNLGGISNLIDRLPSMCKMHDLTKVQMNDQLLTKMEVIINSMTLKERVHPNIIKGSRKRRIALGCGMKVQDVNLLLKQFNEIQYMMKKTKKNGLSKMISNMGGLNFLNFLKQ